MKNIIDIRNLIEEDIFNYQQLINCLQDYRKPRERITQFFKSGEIIRIKKGLYTFSEVLRKQPLCKELIANLIYGPSYLSGEYALSYYGLIPERVTTLTSVTIERSKKYETPVGLFSYKKIINPLYPSGIKIEKVGKLSFLIASPEKALIDKVWFDKSFHGLSTSDYKHYLENDLRIDFERLKDIDLNHMRAIIKSCNRPKLIRLYNFIKTEI